MTHTRTEPGSPSVSPPNSAVAPVDLAAVRRRMIRLAVRLVWNRTDAEDIVQEAFQTALKRGPATNEALFEPWLVRTVGYLCLNYRRRRRPEPLQEWMETSHDASSSTGSLDRAEALDRLRGAIEQLPGQQRLALVLRTMEQMDYGRIAEIMESSVSSVRANVHLARRRLVELLVPSGPEEGS